MSFKKHIVIIGAGPAGVFAACGLYDRGFKNITLISRLRSQNTGGQNNGGQNTGEGISARVTEIIKHYALPHTLHSIGEEVQRFAHWNGTSQSQNREFILDREKFDQALLKDAKEKGIKIINARVTKLKKQPSRIWNIHYENAQGSSLIKADFLIEARGREAKLGSPLKQPNTPRTTALARRYSTAQDLEAMTSIASFKKGWAWFLRDGKGSAYLQIFISSEKGELPPKDKLEHYFSHIIENIPQAQKWLEGSSAAPDALTVRTASPIRRASVIGDDFLNLGDAAMALDPLSGNGIFYAIGSAVSAVPVIATLFLEKKNKQAAFDFYNERINVIFEEACRTAQEFYKSEEQWVHEPFWKARSNEPLPSSQEPAADPNLASASALAPAHTARKSVVKNGFIELEDIIVTPDHPRGVWQINNIPLVKLLELQNEKTYAPLQLAKIFSVSENDIKVAIRWLENLNMSHKNE